MSSSSEKPLGGISISPATVIATIATIYFVKTLWDGMPRWIKKAINNNNDSTNSTNTTTTKANKNGNNKRLSLKSSSDHTNLSNPAIIFDKIKLLFDLIDKKVSDIIPDHLPPHKVFASVISAIHLYEEINTELPHLKEEYYREVSEKEATPQQLDGLVQKMEFADWAYEEHRADLNDKLKHVSFDLLRFDQATEPGRVGHYIAINHDEKIVLIGLKGTSTFSDVLTDVVAHSLEYKLKHSFIDDINNNDNDDDEDEEEIIRAHEGIFSAALIMADETQQLIENLFIPCRYSLLITGHSLGAGTACLLGLLLRSRIPALRNEFQNLIHVYAFAPPPVLNYDAALACAPFVTSIVNNSDVIPRTSLSNLVILNKLFMKVNSKLEERGLSPDNVTTALALAKDLMVVDDDLLISVEELRAFFEETYESEDIRGVDHLYVPGRVIVLFPKEDDKVVKEEEEGKEKEEDGGADDEKKKDFLAVVGDGSMKMLRHVELNSTLLSDHLADSYIDHLKAAST